MELMASSLSDPGVTRPYGGPLIRGSRPAHPALGSPSWPRRVSASCQTTGMSGDQRRPERLPEQFVSSFGPSVTSQATVEENPQAGGRRFDRLVGRHPARAE